MKAAVIHYISGLAFDLAPRGVRANVVSPGNVYFDGGVWQNIEQNNRELFDASIALNPTGRIRHARGDRVCGGDAGQPAGQPDQRHEPRRRRCSHPWRPVIARCAKRRRTSTGRAQGPSPLGLGIPTPAADQQENRAARGRPSRVGTCVGPWHSGRARSQGGRCRSWSTQWARQGSNPRTLGCKTSGSRPPTSTSDKSNGPNLIGLDEAHESTAVRTTNDSTRPTLVACGRPRAVLCRDAATTRGGRPPGGRLSDGCPRPGDPPGHCRSRAVRRDG